MIVVKLAELLTVEILSLRTTFGVVQGWSKYPEFSEGQRLFRFFISFLRIAHLPSIGASLKTLRSPYLQASRFDEGKVLSDRAVGKRSRYGMLWGALFKVFWWILAIPAPLPAPNRMVYFDEDATQFSYRIDEGSQGDADQRQAGSRGTHLA